MDKSKILSQLIEKIKELAPELDLSTPMFIAGGAVANFIYASLHNQSAVINDIDIFIGEKDEDLNLDGAIDSYRSQINSNHYQILSTSRKGILNYVNIKANLDTNDLASQVLDSFDINACKAGIILGLEPRLVLCSDFEQFCKDKTLRIVKFGTPFKSILRALRKSKELNCYIDSSHLLYSYQFQEGQRSVIIESNYLKFKTEIESLTNQGWIEVFKTSRNNYYLKPKMKFLPKTKVEGKIARYHPEFYDKILQIKINKPKLYSKIEKVGNYQKTLLNLICSNLENRLKDSWKEEVFLIEKTLRKIPQLWLDFSNHSLQELVEINKVIYSEEKDRGLKFCFDFAGFLTGKDLTRVENHLKNYIESIIIKSNPLTDSIFHNFSEVLELNSKALLEEEGLKMGHCVAGYWLKISNSHRIFSIKTKEGDSTMECLIKDKKWIGIQHRGKYNRFPPELNRKIANDLVNFMNQKVLNETVS